MSNLENSDDVTIQARFVYIKNMLQVPPCVMAQCRKADFGALINSMAKCSQKYVSILFSKPCHGKTWNSNSLPMVQY